MKKLIVVWFALLAVFGVVWGQDALTGKLEIFSWWAGDEGVALQALMTSTRACILGWK